MTQIVIEGAPLDHHESASWISAVINAGLETTRNAALVGLWLLHQHPVQRRDLAADPSLMKGAVDEILRWSSPSRSRLRVARTNTCVAGTPVKAGDWIVPFVSSANRDETKFADPNTFDIRRDNASEHVAFGEGPHHCLGRHLTKLELGIFFGRLLERFPDYEVHDADHPQWIPDHVANGFTKLPVTLR